METPEPAHLAMNPISNTNLLYDPYNSARETAVAMVKKQVQTSLNLPTYILKFHFLWGVKIEFSSLSVILVLLKAILKQIRKNLNHGF